MSDLLVLALRRSHHDAVANPRVEEVGEIASYFDPGYLPCCHLGLEKPEGGVGGGEVESERMRRRRMVRCGVFRMTL